MKTAECLIMCEKWKEPDGGKECEVGGDFIWA